MISRIFFQSKVKWSQHIFVVKKGDLHTKKLDYTLNISNTKKFYNDTTPYHRSLVQPNYWDGLDYLRFSSTQNSIQCLNQTKSASVECEWESGVSILEARRIQNVLNHCKLKIFGMIRSQTSGCSSRNYLFSFYATAVFLIFIKLLPNFLKVIDIIQYEWIGNVLDKIYYTGYLKIHSSTWPWSRGWFREFDIDIGISVFNREPL